MKRLKIVAIAAAVSLVMTGCRNIEENSVQSNISYRIVDLPNGETTTMVVIEMPDTDTDIPNEPLCSTMRTVSREQMSDIPANTSYGDILEKVGDTQAFCNARYRQYVTDDDRVIQLYFESKDDLCPYSGEELYDRAVPLKYDGEIPDGMMYGILAVDGRFFTHYDTYYTDRITGEYLRVKDAEIEIIFKDGTPATEDDLKAETPVLIKHGPILESYPASMECNKIVILK